MLRHHEKLSPPQSPSLKPVLKNQPRTEETGADDVEQSVDELEGRCFGHGRNGGERNISLVRSVYLRGGVSFKGIGGKVANGPQK
jgi:hypothetical protein